MPKSLDIEKHLILIKGKDKTSDINFCESKKGKWLIRYNNNDKVYTYGYENVIWNRDPKRLNPMISIVYENNQPIFGITSIFDFGTYVRLIFRTGFTKIYPRTALTIERTSLENQKASDGFHYFKTLAKHISEGIDVENNFLSKQYEELTQVSPRSVLSAYLNGKTLKHKATEPQAIFPFRFNASQKKAAERALTEQVSIIEGPPGTGKTQTILNIIANAIVRNETVAVVSNNNSATANVLEKLKQYGLDFFTAYLGNRENKEAFFEGQSGSYPDMVDWVLEDTEIHYIEENLQQSQKILNQMLEYKNKQALLKQELSELKTEYAYFEDYYSKSIDEKTEINSISRLKADKILQLITEHLIKNRKSQFRTMLYNLFVYRIYNLSFYRYSSEVIISYLQKTYYDAKINELSTAIESLNEKLRGYHFEKEMNKYSENSMKLLKAKLANTYAQNSQRKVFREDTHWKEFGKFVSEYPVILSTTHSLRNCVARNYLFDYVLIDEASQVDIVTGALALSCAKNAVIVGDRMQLPNVVPSDTKEKATKIFEKYNLDEAYNYTDKSLLLSIDYLFNDLPKTLLKEHYRCHPKIIGFCNQKFYNNELIILTNDEVEKPLTLYITAEGNHARETFNQRQIDVIFDEIIPDQQIDGVKQSIGIITPYRLQANKLEATKGRLNIEADTVHKFQGREKDVIILSTVSNKVNVNDFADDPNLINVAVSRAINQLIVVVAEGSDKWHGTNIGDLVKYIKYNNFEIVNSRIYSVFDLLYRSYSDKLLEVTKNTKKVSSYHSENLMNIVVKKVLSQSEFKDLGYVLHQPLRMLIKDTSKLTNDERKYAMNILTHTDFVIFNKMDKQPVLVVEVDGYAFHANNHAQLKRDEMKDQILEKYGIPIIRMKTTGSQEEKVLQKRLLEVMKL